ncbi:MAG TPA: hypothetical protein VL132_21855, partial [Planctomycetaceae bacterium]|nr:hypothetical protein [Planctomycetaceae bacterium]
YLCEFERGSLRRAGEVIELLRQGIGPEPRAERIEELLEWNAAVDVAWNSLERGELLVVQSSSISQTVRKIRLLAGMERLVPDAATVGGANGTTIAFSAN